MLTIVFDNWKGIKRDIGPFENRKSANDWIKEFGRLYEKRFGMAQFLLDMDIIHSLNTQNAEKPISPRRLFNEIYGEQPF